MTPDAVNLLALIATIVLALMAVFAGGVNYFLLRVTMDPSIVVYTALDDRHGEDVLLVIKNVGKGVAYDVRFECDGPLPRDSLRKNEKMTRGPLIDGIPLLAPGEERAILWGYYGDLSELLGDRSVKVTAFYGSKGNHPWSPTDLTSESVIELASFEATRLRSDPLHRVVEILERLSQDVQTIADGIAPKRR